MAYQSKGVCIYFCYVLRRIPLGNIIGDVIFVENENIESHNVGPQATNLLAQCAPPNYLQILYQGWL